MKFRKLQIAWSVLWALATVLLIALWVRSYWWMDNIQILLTPMRAVQYHSHESSFYVYSHTQPLDWLQRTLHIPKSDPDFAGWRQPHPVFEYWVSEFPANSVRIRIPYWFAVLVFGVIAAAPWLRWRFTLRTLLIATTLVAVVLGLAVYLVRTH